MKITHESHKQHSRVRGRGRWFRNEGGGVGGYADETVMIRSIIID